MDYFIKTGLLFLLSLIYLAGCTGNSREKGKAGQKDLLINKLTEAEKQQGWELLFDGKTFDGWRGIGSDKVPATWNIKDGTIQKTSNEEMPVHPNGQEIQRGDLMTVDTFLNFDLSFEWRISKAGNSGIKYNVSEKMSAKGDSHSALGFEYQILDNKGYTEKLHPSQYSASLYDMIAAKNVQLKPVGEYNTSRILFDGNHGEHWLNGVKVVEYDLGTEHFDSLFQKSKYIKYPDFPKKKAGHIVLQDHSNKVWFRNIKIRRLKN
jgi:hypothetical protein